MTLPLSPPLEALCSFFLLTLTLQGSNTLAQPHLCHSLVSLSLNMLTPSSCSDIVVTVSPPTLFPQTSLFSHVSVWGDLLVLNDNIGVSESYSNVPFTRNPSTSQCSASKSASVCTSSSVPIWHLECSTQVRPWFHWACLLHPWEQSGALSDASQLSEYNQGSCTGSLELTMYDYVWSWTYPSPVLGLLCAPLPRDGTQGFTCARQAPPTSQAPSTTLFHL